MKKNELIGVFDRQALAYDSFRPRYPRMLIEDLLELSAWKHEDHLLEIGCGTGQLTIDLLKNGCQVLAIEKGPNLSGLARKHMAPYPNGSLIQARFEDWYTATPFDLVVSAQAFHWIDREIGVQKVISHLKKGGFFALIWTLDRSESSDFWKQTSPIYQRYFPNNPPKKALGHVSLEYEAYLPHVPALENLMKRTYTWEKCYTKEQYLGLLSTFSDHMTLGDSVRDSFFAEIKTAIEANGNQVVRSYQTVMLLARKKGG